MAKITNRHLFTLTGPDTGGEAVRVGHNRTLQTRRDAGGGREIICRLHGSPVVRLDYAPTADLDAPAVLELHPCGYRTATTRQAMHDFLDALGLPGRVSFAGGDLSARICGADYAEGRDGRPHGSLHVILTTGDLRAAGLIR